MDNHSTAPAALLVAIVALAQSFFVSVLLVHVI